MEMGAKGTGGKGKNGERAKRGIGGKVAK